MEGSRSFLSHDLNKESGQDIVQTVTQLQSHQPVLKGYNSTRTHAKGITFITEA